MKALKTHPQPYNTLSNCLEAYFGDRHTARNSRRAAPRKRNEPEQGLKTIPFQSLPLQLDYMQRRKPRSLISLRMGS
ncbi:hypothetical protein [Pontiella agarivorans]|uniref:Uncharacterized protein n=1 Tax=Pontiella agarivorans TaxID=3038953 RepID=A0ABU5N0Y6_9BACT|nr:hypothetical protein [Pontiella agarivorans]MDZ8120098.1 hypothetical protein [Pontiella agarivorans]